MTLSKGKGIKTPFYLPILEFTYIPLTAFYACSCASLDGSFSSTRLKET